jgi:ferredoxin
VTLHPQEEVGFIDIGSRLKESDPEALIYVCGPAPFIEAVRTEARALGRGSQVRSELFVASEPRPLVDDVAFDVRLERSGVDLRVESGRSILDTVLEAGVEVPRDCEEGLCGTCVTTVLEGEVDHRDDVLDEASRASNRAMAICVSRSAGGRLVLDA